MANPSQRKKVTACKTCGHPRRDEIEADFVMNRLRRGAKSNGAQDGFHDKYEIHFQSVHTHMTKHVSQDDLNIIYAAEREKSAKELVHGDRTDVIATLHKLSAEAELFLTQAKDNEDLRGGIAVVAELRKQVELSAKLLGQLGDGSSQLILAKHPEWLKVRNIILQVLDNHPEAKAEFLSKLGTAAIGHDQ